MKSLLEKIILGGDLNASNCVEALAQLRNPDVLPEQKGAFLAALQTKGVHAQEISGFAKALLKEALPLEDAPKGCMDVCGTGGDSQGTFNISTTVAFVAASAGIPVAKHGNRSVSSQCGSADVLEILGVPTQLPPEDAARMLRETGFGFLFAPLYHPAMRELATLRRNLGVRTIFNLLGPLLNPARVKKQVVGIYDVSKIKVYAEALLQLGSKEALVVCADGLDEISTMIPTHYGHLKNGKVKLGILNAKSYGFKKPKARDLLGSGPMENAEITLEILKGAEGPKRDIVALNAGAAIWIAGAAKDLKSGIRIALEVLDSGKAFHLIERVRAWK